MKKSILILLLSLSASICLFSQSADKVSQMITTEKVTYGQVAYFAGIAANLFEDTISEDEAISILKQEKILKKDVSAEDFINLSNLSWIFSNVWKMDRSLMLKIFPCPRYAFNQLKADRIIEQNSDPWKIPSGYEVLSIITRCLEQYKTIEKIDIK